MHVPLKLGDRIDKTSVFKVHKIFEHVCKCQFVLTLKDVQSVGVTLVLPTDCITPKGLLQKGTTLIKYNNSKNSSKKCEKEFLGTLFANENF